MIAVYIPSSCFKLVRKKPIKYYYDHNKGYKTLGLISKNMYNQSTVLIAGIIKKIYKNLE